LFGQGSGIISPGVASLSYRETVIADGATYYWRLGESSGTSAAAELGGRTGTYVASPTLGVTGALSGDADTAVTFNGSTQFVYTIAGTWTLVNYTLECWVKFTSNAYQRIISLQDLNVGPDPFIILRTSDGAGGAGKKFTFQSTGSSISTTGTYGDGAWYHVVVVRNKGGTNQIYVNGTSDASGGDGNSVHTRAGRGAIAALISDISGAGEYFLGTIDEVAIYEGTVLTQPQALAHYNKGAGL